MKIALDKDFARLVRAFEAAPAKTKQMVRQQVLTATRDIQEEARDNHRFTTRSGQTEKQGILKEVNGNTGVVYLGTDVAVYLHEGTQAHKIVPRDKMVLRFVGRANRFVFAKRVRHPGTEADPFLYRAAEKLEPVIQSRFSAAVTKILEGI